jgi:glutaredoxin
VPKTELYGSDQCPYTRELREWLEWTRRDFREYNVDTDPEALARAKALVDGAVSVPILVENNIVIQVGWQGRSCMVMTDKGAIPSQESPNDDAEYRDDRVADQPGSD